jgi:hypothetical protein
MKVLTCAAARRRLQAYHDGELPIGDQIDVDAHLEWCDHCATALTDMQLLRAVLRATAPSRGEQTSEEDTNLQASVVSRIRAENTMSLSARTRAMFDDMHMVYAGLGAAAATIACVMVMLSMMRFATSEHSPGSNQNPVVVDARMLLPRPLDQVLMTAGSKDGDEAVFTLSAVVTREGRIVNLELHGENGETLEANSSEAQALQGLLGMVSRTRFEPARVAGLPVAVSMVWMVAHTTVRAAKEPELPTTPTAKKRRAEWVPPAVGPARSKSEVT